MKKKLEAELISIAHRILKLKNKSDLIQLQQETQRLYEKLSVLRFVEENLADVKPTIGYAEMEDKLAVIFDNESDGQPAQPVETAAAEPQKEEAIGEIVSGIAENAAKQQEPETTGEVQTAQTEVQPDVVLDEEKSEAYHDDAAQEATVEPEAPKAVAEAASETPKQEEHPAEAKPAEQAFKPAFEWGFEAKAETPADEPKIAAAQISFDDLLGQDYVDPVFVKPEEMHNSIPTPVQTENERRAAEMAESNRKLADLMAGRKSTDAESPKENVIPISRNFVDTSNVIPINKENLNDRMGKAITIGLNDRIAFMKHLFNNSSEDYNRVLSQLITFGTLDEAKGFIDQIVKPDYNNWDGKDEYEQRFMEIVEKKFS